MNQLSYGYWAAKGSGPYLRVRPGTVKNDGGCNACSRLTPLCSHPYRRVTVFDVGGYQFRLCRMCLDQFKRIVRGAP